MEHSQQHNLLTIEELVNKEWITLRQFANLTGKRYQTILKWKKEGKFKAVLVGGQHRVYVDEVRRFLSEGNAGE